MRYYSYLAVFENGKDCVGVCFPDLDVFIMEEPIEKARDVAKQALADWIDDAIRNGRPIPRASEANEIELDDGEWLERVNVDLADYYSDYGRKRGGARQGAGRPKLSDEERASEMLMVRVTKAEKKALAELALKAELTKSGLIREWIREHMK